MDIIVVVNKLETDWKYVLTPILERYKQSIDEKLTHDIETFKDTLEVVPPSDLIFNAFNMFNQSELKVCIIGMDPYIHKGEAMGLSFSVPRGTKCPPSLRNIFKELENEYGTTRTNTDLTDWARQGVLLLNTALTTLENKTGHHIKIWKDLTHDIINHIAHHFQHIVYILWGAHAQSFEPFIDPAKNLILKHSHPSPLSRKPFVGNGHFKTCNEYLAKHNLKEIDWFGE
jgi:uracil-DNA glycosylase